MMRITADTTLGELAIALGKLGVEQLLLKIEPRQQRAYIVQVKRRLGAAGSFGRAEYQSAQGATDSGAALHEAIDNALARFLHRSAESLPREAP